MTGKLPLSEFTDHNVTVLISKGKRPSMPRSFDVPGMTPAVWKIAKKCWHEKAKERPEVTSVLRYLENMSNPGECTREIRSRLEWGPIDSQ